MGQIYVPPAPPSYRKVVVLGSLALAAFLSVEALLVRSFAKEDTRPPSWDQSIHMEIALDYKEAIAEGRWSDLWHLPPKPGMPAFPPAYHLLLTRAYSAADPADAALWVNWLYLALLAAAVFGVAFHFKPDSTAVAAAIAFCAAPGIQEMLTTQLIDLPLTALAAAAYWALLASDGFRWWPGSLLFGLLHALGMLHKWSFFSYMLPAYWVAARALGDKHTRGQVLVSAGLSAALSAPWYLSHIVLMPSRLVQASADFAVSPTKPEAWFEYVRQAATVFGPAFVTLGIAGLLAPQYARRGHDGWHLLAWFLAGYVFWTIVPNRQYRFVLPALPPLAVGLICTWPKAVSWAVAGLQVLLMFNFYSASVDPVRVPGLSVWMFHSRPAQVGDWKVEEILARVETERDPSRPITNVTLVANDEYINAPTFHWTLRRLGLKHARIRSVNRRLCELSEFVVLKDPKLGPPSVILSLPEAAQEIKDPNGWFQRAYEHRAEWPLPDGSTAHLYRQRRGLKRPLPSKELRYEVLNLGRAEIQDLKLSFGEWDAGNSAFKTVGVSLGVVAVRGLVLRGVAAELADAGFVPTQGIAAQEWGDVRLLRLGALRIKSLQLEGLELKAFLEERVKGLQLYELELEDGRIRARGRFKGVAVAAEAAPVLLEAPRRLRIEVRSLKAAGVPLPVSLLREIKELTIPLEPTPETPFSIELKGLTLAGGRLTVP